ncbi:MAG: twin-arginine translocase TatA/TatE family subunit [Clostridium sp.]|nr:twin-arginine translocase TatA/TatE family subunit [Clostridium sp.]
MNTTALVPAFLNLGTGEIILICFVILLLFGGRKIPELMRGIGKGVKGFRQGMNEITDEINRPESDGAGKPAPAPKKDQE